MLFVPSLIASTYDCIHKQRTPLFVIETRFIVAVVVEVSRSSWRCRIRRLVVVAILVAVEARSGPRLDLSMVLVAVVLWPCRDRVAVVRAVSKESVPGM